MVENSIQNFREASLTEIGARSVLIKVTVLLTFSHESLIISIITT